MIRALRLGHRDAVDVLVDRRIQILLGELARAVDAHNHVGAAAPHAFRRRRDELACRALLGGRHAVLEVELDAVRAARVRLVDVFLDVDRHIHERAPDGEVLLHSSSLLASAAPSTTIPPLTISPYRASSKPSSESNSRLCCPSLGAGLRIAPGVPSRRGTTWCIGKAPMSSSG